MSARRRGTTSTPTTPVRQDDACDAQSAAPGDLRRVNGNEPVSGLNGSVFLPGNDTSIAWSAHDDATLRDEYPHHGPAGTHAKLPHHTLDAIRERALQLGVHERHRPWKPGELECLKVVFPRGGADAVQEKLPTRSLEAIRHKAHDLGLKHNRRSATTLSVFDIKQALDVAGGNVAQAARSLECDAASLRRVATSQGLIFEKDTKPHWKVTEIEILRADYPTGGATAVQAKLPKRSIQAIYRMAARLGLAGGDD